MQLHGKAFSPVVSLQTILVAAALLPFVRPADVKIAMAQEPQHDEPHSEAAIIAADVAWDKAESSGDTAYIDNLLLPEYRSVNTDGSIHSKLAILSSAKNNAGSPDRAAAVAKWRVAHPYLMSVSMTGDTAILTFILDSPGAPKAVMSCDIFVYREGRWRALYSQHTQAGK
jgi:hypothetical protein